MNLTLGRGLDLSAGLSTWPNDLNGFRDKFSDFTVLVIMFQRHILTQSFWEYANK